MGTIVHLKMRKEPPRGARGGRVLRKGQTIVSLAGRVKYVIRRIYKDGERRRVVISEKGRHHALERDLAESSIKCKALFMLEEDYIKFDNELRHEHPEFFWREGGPQ